MTENEIQAQILTYLKYRNILATRNQSGHVRVGRNWINLGAPGWPDIIGCLPGGRFFGIEVKRPGEKPSPIQQQRANQITAAGGLMILAMSVEDVAEGIKNALP